MGAEDHLLSLYAYQKASVVLTRAFAVEINQYLSFDLFRTSDILIDIDLWIDMVSCEAHFVVSIGFK